MQVNTPGTTGTYELVHRPGELESMGSDTSSDSGKESFSGNRHGGSRRRHGNSSLSYDSLPQSRPARLDRPDRKPKLENPLAGLTEAELREKGRDYANNNGMGDMVDLFEAGAVVAADPNNFEGMDISDELKDALRIEVTDKWKQPKALWHLVVMCSVAAAVQGMDETVINGAQLFFRDEFGIGGSDSQSQFLLGLVNSAPYLACALLGCWLTDPLNQAFGRKWTIFLTCLLSGISCVWQGFTNSWQHLFVARLILGLGIGPKSSTVPIYAAECAPPKIRGALVMMWQMFTAFGIMVGFVADLLFFKVESDSIPGLNWRLMLASAAIPAFMVCTQVFFCPESPRYYMSKKRPEHRKAFESLAKIRLSKIQAARDVFYMYTLLEAEKEIVRGNWRILELFTVPRNRRAMIGSEIVMFMQQFCGINVIAYYSAVIFVEGGVSEQMSLVCSLIFGIINFLFAIPAVYTIDTFGRRNLLLTTFPLMFLALLFTGWSFTISSDTIRIGCVATGIYLFTMVYSPGAGPVPFTYSAEAYPLYVRGLGMSLATATTWGFNWILAITWPNLLGALKAQGAFTYYACWNVVGFFLVLFFLPETKGKTLEELDVVFGVSTREHAKYGARQIPYFFKRYILGRDVYPEKLYDEPEEVRQERYNERGSLDIDNEAAPLVVP